MAILAAVSWSVPAFAQAAAPANSAASAPGPVERAENATKKAVKATKKAGNKVVTATKKGAKKASDAITRTGEKIDKKIPRTKAYEKKQADQAAPATDAK